jgi:hypothetical protein
MFHFVCDRKGVGLKALHGMKRRRRSDASTRQAGIRKESKEPTSELISHFFSYP